MKIILAILIVFVVTFVDATTTRSASTTAAFRKVVACPSTHKFNGPCPGWIMDHMHSLRCGGKDVPENLWWQTVEEAKLKDQQESQCWRYYPPQK